MTKLDENKETSKAKAEDEIEITPAMIEAGVKVYRLGWADEPEDGVKCIFLDMWEAMKRETHE